VWKLPKIFLLSGVSRFGRPPAPLPTEGFDSFGFLVNSRPAGNPARRFAFILRREFDMFRFLSRVVVVSVFALSLNIAIVPAAQAKPFESGKVDSGMSRGWVDEALDWLNRFLGHPVKDKNQGPKQVVANDGGVCIDPMGNPKPCA
jgi:hypothetical protein